jgi:cephalosporin-C deacetylase-like acetyl esterase
LSQLLQGLELREPLSTESEAPHLLRSPADPDERQHRQVDELVDFTQKLLEQSAQVRDQLWSKADRSSPAAYAKSAERYRDLVWRTMIGKLPDPAISPNVRTRKIIEDPSFTGYEVVIDVYPDVIAGGILLLPTDLKPSEKRPVVVCQHGLEGVPMDTITTSGEGYKYYKGFTAALAKRGFITYAPQNPYRGTDRFRTIQRKSNPLGRSLYSYIIPQHERTLAWLSTLPPVDRNRIGFYGLSYGGKTAVRVPTMVPQYALSICSGDFNEWVRKNATNASTYSYVFTGEYEIFEWNMGHVANYAELASLMTPRPFMVERGLVDGVAPDEWVAWEYAKVRRH